MSEAQTRKIAPHHLEREACLYVRQSSLRQVMRNTESTRRQYGLSQRATALGWPMERIRVIDEDQGKSGAYSENRSGFRDLMGSIAAGEVGIVLGLEVSRLARDNADWRVQTPRARRSAVCRQVRSRSQARARAGSLRGFPAGG